MMLRIGGYLNMLISFGHIAGLFWAAQMFRLTGVEHKMQELSAIHYSLPYVLETASRLEGHVETKFSKETPFSSNISSTEELTPMRSRLFTSSRPIFSVQATRNI